MVEDSAFIAALVLNVALFILFVTLYCILRPRYPRIYNPRAPSLGPDTGPVQDMPGLLGWARQAWAVSDEEVYRLAGLDALVHTAFLRYG